MDRRIIGPSVYSDRKSIMCAIRAQMDKLGRSGKERRDEFASNFSAFFSLKVFLDSACANSRRAPVLCRRVPLSIPAIDSSRRPKPIGVICSAPVCEFKTPGCWHSRSREPQSRICNFENRNPHFFWHWTFVYFSWFTSVVNVAHGSKTTPRAQRAREIFGLPI